MRERTSNKKKKKNTNTARAQASDISNIERNGMAKANITVSEQTKSIITLTAALLSIIISGSFSPYGPTQPNNQTTHISSIYHWPRPNCAWIDCKRTQQQQQTPQSKSAQFLHINAECDFFLLIVTFPRFAIYVWLLGAFCHCLSAQVFRIIILRQRVWDWTG